MILKIPLSSKRKAWSSHFPNGKFSQRHPHNLTFLLGMPIRYMSISYLRKYLWEQDPKPRPAVLHSQGSHFDIDRIHLAKTDWRKTLMHLVSRLVKYVCVWSWNTCVAITFGEFPKEIPINCFHLPQTPGKPEGSSTALVQSPSLSLCIRHGQEKFYKPKCRHQSQWSRECCLAQPVNPINNYKRKKPLLQQSKPVEMLSLILQETGWAP